jgi:hypothetical protein
MAGEYSSFIRDKRERRGIEPTLTQPARRYNPHKCGEWELQSGFENGLQSRAVTQRAGKQKEESRGQLLAELTRKSTRLENLLFLLRVFAALR